MLLTCITLIIGKMCTLLASRGQCIIWRVCAGAEKRCAVWDFQHPRHAAVLCTSEFNVMWILASGIFPFLLVQSEAKLCFLQEKQTRLIRQFHFHGWPEIGIPADGKGMIDIIAAVQKQQQQSGNNPIVVHCRYTLSQSYLHIIKPKENLLTFPYQLKHCTMCYTNLYIPVVAQSIIKYLNCINTLHLIWLWILIGRTTHEAHIKAHQCLHILEY